MRKIPRIGIGGPAAVRCGFKMVYSSSHRNTFVRGTCAQMSALLVTIISISITVMFLILLFYYKKDQKSITNYLV